MTKNKDAPPRTYYYADSSDVSRRKILDTDMEFVLKKEYDQLAAEVERLNGELQSFKDGVQTFRCPHCKQCAAPFFEVNLNSENSKLRSICAELIATLELCAKIHYSEELNNHGCMATAKVTDIAEMALEKAKAEMGDSSSPLIKRGHVPDDVCE